MFDHVVKTMHTKLLTNLLTPFQEFICLSIKLRLNSPIQYLAYHFDILKATISRIISKWLMQMGLQGLIVLPDCESLRKTMPLCFQESFVKKRRDHHLLF